MTQTEILSKKQIIHLDMDAFYAAVEVLDNPSLRGQPVIVGGTGSRGVVCTASYEARRLGVHSAMPVITARKLCPHGVYVRPRLKRYQELSVKIMAIFGRYTPMVEPLSIDEAFLDVTGSLRLFGSADNIARRLKAEVYGETGLTVSAGVASQKHLAKIASGMNKPDGLTVVPVGEELAFLHPLSLKNLWGAGRVMQGKLKSLGLVTVGDLAQLERSFLEKRFGRGGGQLWDLANGFDPREVTPGNEAKSIGAEETFSRNLTDSEEIKAALLAQTFTVVGRMRDEKLRARTVTVKFRDGDFKTMTRARSLAKATDLRDEIYREVLKLYQKEAAGLGPMRLLGVTLSRFSTPAEDQGHQAPPVQGSLFDMAGPDEGTSPEAQAKVISLNLALDKVSNRFGPRALRPASVAATVSDDDPQT